MTARAVNFFSIPERGTMMMANVDRTLFPFLREERKKGGKGHLYPDRRSRSLALNRATFWVRFLGHKHSATFQAKACSRYTTMHGGDFSSIQVPTLFERCHVSSDGSSTSALLLDFLRHILLPAPSLLLPAYELRFVAPRTTYYDNFPDMRQKKTYKG